MARDEVPTATAVFFCVLCERTKKATVAQVTLHGKPSCCGLQMIEDR